MGERRPGPPRRPHLPAPPAPQLVRPLVPQHDVACALRPRTQPRCDAREARAQRALWRRGACRRRRWTGRRCAGDGAPRRRCCARCARPALTRVDARTACGSRAGRFGGLLPQVRRRKGEHEVRRQRQAAGRHRRAAWLRLVAYHGASRLLAPTANPARRVACQALSAAGVASRCAGVPAVPGADRVRRDIHEVRLRAETRQALRLATVLTAALCARRAAGRARTWTRSCSARTGSCCRERARCCGAAGRAQRAEALCERKSLGFGGPLLASRSFGFEWREAKSRV